MPLAIDYFRPRGEPLTVHRNDRDIAEVDFSLAVTSAEITEANAIVTYWEPVAGEWTENNDNFQAPEAEVMGYGAIRFFIEPINTLAPGRYGAKVVFEVPDGKRLVSDHPLTVRGAMSE